MSGGQARERRGRAAAARRARARQLGGVNWHVGRGTPEYPESLPLIRTLAVSPTLSLGALAPGRRQYQDA